MQFVRQRGYLFFNRWQKLVCLLLPSPLLLPHPRTLAVLTRLARRVQAAKGQGVRESFFVLVPACAPPHGSGSGGTKLVRNCLGGGGGGGGYDMTVRGGEI